jgi:hypothetical protein
MHCLKKKKFKNYESTRLQEIDCNTFKLLAFIFERERERIIVIRIHMKCVLG